MSDSACFSDIQYCKTLSTSLLWVDHWTAGIISFKGFGSSLSISLITRMFLVKFSKFLCRFQRLSSKILRDYRKIKRVIEQNIFANFHGILELSLWNLHKNFENLTRNILVINESRGMSQNPWKKWFQQSNDPLIIKKYLKFYNIEYQKNTHCQTLLYRLSHLPISVDYQTLARLKIDWTCQILNLSSLLPTHFFTIYDWYINFRGLDFFWILLGHLCNSATWVFTFSHFLTLFASFWRFIRAVWFYFFILSFVSHGSRL